MKPLKILSPSISRISSPTRFLRFYYPERAKSYCPSSLQASSQRLSIFERVSGESENIKESQESLRFNFYTTKILLNFIVREILELVLFNIYS